MTRHRPAARPGGRNRPARPRASAVRDAGSIRAYERLHRTTLANILNRGTRLPADVIPKIVDFWAHVGWYARRG